MDSIGLNCQKEVLKGVQYIKSRLVYNSTQYQDFSVSCGCYCLYFMNVHSVGTTCYNVVKVFSPTDNAYNEKFIKHIL